MTGFVYSQRAGDADWIFLVHASVSPYTDTRPLLQPGKPEQRRYGGVFVKKDQEIGQFSGDVVVTLHALMGKLLGSP